jgi:hypothetical protein
MNIESSLYMYSSIFSMIAFIVCLKFIIDPYFGWSPKHTFNNMPYGTYPIVILGFLSLSKGLEYLEKSIYKSKEQKL